MPFGPRPPFFRWTSILTFLNIWLYDAAMDTQMKLFASARTGALRREADTRRRLSAWTRTCRRWLLGIIPVSERCAC